MSKIYFILTFLLSSVFCSGQGHNEIVIEDKACPSLNTSSPILNELTFSDKEVTKYLKTKYQKTLPKSPVEINLILFPEAQPCCKKTVIVDSHQISKSQKDSLLNYIISFPDFSKIKIDKPKRLRLFITFDEKKGPVCTFINDH